MTTGFFNPASGRRKLALLFLFVMALVLLVVIGGWNLLNPQPEARTTGSCSAMNRAAEHEGRMS